MMTKQQQRYIQLLGEAIQASREGKPVAAGRALEASFKAIPEKVSDDRREFALFIALEKALQLVWE